METATIYHITCNKAWSMWTEGTGWSLEPWPGDGPYTQGYDDGGHEYILPDGYHVGQVTDGSPAIFADGKDRAEILVDGKGHPALVIDWHNVILHRA